jgi:hypothetical protein
VVALEVVDTAQDGVVGAPGARLMKSSSARAMAMKMPSITPRTATPRKHTIDRVNSVLAPAASATGVREELLLTENAWKRPAATLAAPRATSSWFGSTRSPPRIAKVRESTLVSANETRAIPMAPATRTPRSWAGTPGSWTATSTPGTLGRHRLQARITARQATPMISAVRLVSPSATPPTKARASGITPSASTEKPKSLGSWLSSTVSAMPFM